MTSRLTTGLCASAAAVLLAGVAVSAHHTLAERIDTDARSAEDRARDAGRRPAAVLQFLGLEAGMDVIDIMAAGGWYTEVLAHAVGADGTVAAQNTPAMLQFRDGANDKAMAARLDGDRLPNVTRLDGTFEDIASNAGPYDLALSALNFHDVYNRNGRDAAVGMLMAVKSTLKPGGVFGIIDHAGNPDADNESMHRIDKAVVIDAAEAAGFLVDGDSDLLSSGEDDRTQPVFAEGVRGKTDRFLLRLKKPAD